jgi:hypothetical protein
MSSPLVSGSFKSLAMPLHSGSSDEMDTVSSDSSVGSFHGRQLPMIAHSIPRSCDSIAESYRGLQRELSGYNAKVVVDSKHALLQLSELATTLEKVGAVMSENNDSLAQGIELRELPEKLQKQAEERAKQEEAEKSPPPPFGMYM